MLENIKNGKALEKFKQLVEKQGGKKSSIDNIENMPMARFIEPIYSLKSGYISKINALEVGKIACELGAGRVKKEDNIDFQAGIILNKKVSDYIEKGQVLAYIYTNKSEAIENAKSQYLNNVEIQNEKIENNKTILEIIK